MHQDATWYGGRQLCVKWEPSPHPQKGGGAPSQILRVEAENLDTGPEVRGTSGYI